MAVTYLKNGIRLQMSDEEESAHVLSRKEDAERENQEKINYENKNIAIDNILFRIGMSREEFLLLKNNVI